MNYTKNYHLPQWIKEDRIMMEDFNAMNSSIESGLTTANTNASAANSKADAAVQAAGTAQQTANAAYSPSNKPYVVGSYTGTGIVQHIDLGFRPSFVIISGMQGATVVNSAVWIANYAITGGNALKFRVEMENTGFTVYQVGYQTYQGPDLAAKDMVFDYIAFK